MWLRDGRRVAVRVPDGCLFLQAGRQLERLTGGHVVAGMHEACAGTPETPADPLPSCPRRSTILIPRHDLTWRAVTKRGLVAGRCADCAVLACT